MRATIALVGLCFAGVTAAETWVDNPSGNAYDRDSIVAASGSEPRLNFAVFKNNPVAEKAAESGKDTVLTYADSTLSIAAPKGARVVTTRGYGYVYKQAFDCSEGRVVTGFDPRTKTFVWASVAADGKDHISRLYQAVCPKWWEFWK